MREVKSAKLAISKVALLTPCMEVKIFCGQIPSFEVLWMCHYWTFSIMCLSFFQIQNLCHSEFVSFWAKRWFSQKDIHTAFSFLFSSVLLSCYHHLKAKLGMYFAPSIFEDFRMVCLKHLDWSRCDPFWQNHGKGSVNWDKIFVINNNSIQNKMCKKI